MGFRRKGNVIKQPPIKVETEAEIRSININGEQYLHYGDVITFLMDHVDPEVRWELDNKTFRT